MKERQKANGGENERSEVGGGGFPPKRPEEREYKRVSNEMSPTKEQGS